MHRVSIPCPCGSVRSRRVVCRLFYFFVKSLFLVSGLPILLRVLLFIFRWKDSNTINWSCSNRPVSNFDFSENRSVLFPSAIDTPAHPPLVGARALRLCLVTLCPSSFPFCRRALKWRPIWLKWRD